MPSPRVKRMTSLILRMAMWGRGTGTSSGVVVDCPRQAVGALRPAQASATPSHLPGVRKPPGRVYGNPGTGVRNESERVLISTRTYTRPLTGHCCPLGRNGGRRLGRIRSGVHSLGQQRHFDDQRLPPPTTAGPPGAVGAGKTEAQCQSGKSSSLYGAYFHSRQQPIKAQVQKEEGGRRAPRAARGPHRMLPTKRSLTMSNGSPGSRWSMAIRHSSNIAITSFNQGVPQTRHLWDPLCHASPAMTGVYAHLHDATLRQESSAIASPGSTSRDSYIGFDPDAATADAEWVKHNLAHAADTLPQRLLRAAAATGMSPPQCLSHLRPVPDLSRVPARPPPTKSTYCGVGRCRRRHRASAPGRQPPTAWPPTWTRSSPPWRTCPRRALKMTDRVEALRQAAQARHNATVRRAKDAIQALVAAGTPVTFAQLAKADQGLSVLALLPRRTTASRCSATADRAPAKLQGRAAGPVGDRRVPPPAAPCLPRRDSPPTDREPSPRRPARPLPRSATSRQGHSAMKHPVEDMSTTSKWPPTWAFLSRVGCENLHYGK